MEKGKCLSITLALLFAFSGCSQMEYSEYSYERIDLTNSTNIMIIHNSNCPAHKAVIKPTSNKRAYIKYKHHLFCKICWEKEEVRLMNMYSRTNIAEGNYMWNEYNYMASAEDVNDYHSKEAIKDKTNRLWTVEYSLNKDGDLVKLDIFKIPREYLFYFDCVDYVVEGSCYRIPHSKEGEFLKCFPTAKQLNYNK